MVDTDNDMLLSGRERASSGVTGSSVSSSKRTKSKVSALIKLIWDEFYLCDPNNEKISD